jgi:hypothetical protein
MSAQSLLNTPNLEFSEFQATTITGNGSNLYLENNGITLDIGGNSGNLNLTYNSSGAYSFISSSGNLALSGTGYINLYAEDINLVATNIVTAPTPNIPSNTTQVATTGYVYSILRTGAAAVGASASTTIDFLQPFPPGSVPNLFIQNSQGNTWENIIFTTSNVTNTSFTINQYNITSPGNYEVVAISYLAILPVG